MTMKKIYNLDDVNEDVLGCWIDGTHMSGLSFDIEVVETALHFGWELDVNDWKELKNQLINYQEEESLYEDLAGVAEEAYDWFNMNLPEGYYFEIDANCLFLTHEDLELIND